MDSDKDTDLDTSSLPALEHTGVGESGPTRMVPAFPIVGLKAAPWNPRKHFDVEQLAALAADIGARGILEPLIVRNVLTHHEIVCGERRFLAAQRAGLEAVPVIVRVLDDREALECAISENGQREGLHPLEEADGFLTLHTTHGESVDDIAARFGISPKWVHARLSLARMCPEARTAFPAGKILAGVAYRIARLPSHDFQRAAVEQFTLHGTVWGNSEAARWIQNRFHLRLVTAPFDCEDTELVPSAGACSACPKNTSAQAALFGDAENAAECTDPVCFASKKQRAWEVASAALADGRKVLTADQSAGIFHYIGNPPAGGYVDPSMKPYEHGGRKTWRELLGNHGPATVIARTVDGKPAELYEPDAFKAAVKTAGLGKLKKLAKAKRSSSSSSRPSTPESYREREAEALAVSVLKMGAVAELYRKRPYDPEDRAWWQAITKVVLFIGDETKELVTYLKLDITKKRKGLHDYQLPAAALMEEIECRSPAGCRELLVLALLVGVLQLDSVSAGSAFAPLVKLYGLDLKALEKKAIAERKAAKKVEAPKPTASKPSSKPTTKPGKSPPSKKPTPKPVAKPATKKPAKKARS